MDIFEKQKFCQETLIQLELANPKEKPLDHHNSTTNSYKNKKKRHVTTTKTRREKKTNTYLFLDNTK